MPMDSDDHEIVFKRFEIIEHILKEIPSVRDLMVAVYLMRGADEEIAIRRAGELLMMMYSNQSNEK